MSDGFWLGVKRCGCPVAVVVDNPEYRLEVEKSKRRFLKEGLQVVAATRKEWEDLYMPKFYKDYCEHGK